MRRSDPDHLGPPCLGGLTTFYTTNDPAPDCRVIDRSPPDEGSWADLSCAGVAG